MTELVAQPTAADLLLPEGTRLIHIGPPKTGTSTLQAAFHARRREVLAQGVRYAGRARHSGSAVQAVVGGRSFRQDRGSPPIGSWLRLAREVRGAREPRVLLSSEFFADAAAEKLPRIVEDLGTDRLHVAVTLRPLARILASQWQQYVQSNMRTDLDSWLEGIFNGPPDKMTPSFWRRHRHDELVERWAAVVGAEHMTVVVIDEHDHDHILRVFEGLLGLAPGVLFADEDSANRSMTWPEIEAVRAFNSAYWDAGLRNALFHRVLHFGAAPFMKQRRPGPDEPRIVVPEWALERSVELAGAMIARIRATGVRVVGDLGSLVDRPRAAISDESATDGPGAAGVRTGPHAPCVDPVVAAGLAMGIIVVTGGARGRPAVDALFAATGAPDPKLGPRGAGGPGAREPAGVSRYRALIMLGVVGRRVVSGLVGRVEAARSRSRHPAFGGPGPAPGTAASAATEMLGGWVSAAALSEVTRSRIALVGGSPWLPRAEVTSESESDGRRCLTPEAAAGLAMGALVSSGQVRPVGRAGQSGTGAGSGVPPALRPVIFAWAEPPELAVISSKRLLAIVLRRLSRAVLRELSGGRRGV